MTDDLYLTGANWRHAKSGKIYHIDGFATREEDMVLLVIYRGTYHTSTDPIWVRPASEFFDGRFIRLFNGIKPAEPAP